MTALDRPIRVLIADDQPLIRDGLSSLLALQSDLEIVGAATNGDEAVTLAFAETPDVILMDVRMPGSGGVVATRVITERKPECRVLMLTTFDDEEYVVSALAAGATGYLLKDTPMPLLVDAIRQAHEGMFQLTPSAGAKLVELLQRRGSPNTAVASSFEQLSERERQVFDLVVRGRSNGEIARELFITEGTVKNHLSRILATLSLRDRTQVIIFAYEHGLA